MYYNYSSLSIYSNRDKFTCVSIVIIAIIIKHKSIYYTWRRMAIHILYAASPSEHIYIFFSFCNFLNKWLWKFTKKKTAVTIIRRNPRPLFVGRKSRRTLLYTRLPDTSSILPSRPIRRPPHISPARTPPMSDEVEKKTHIHTYVFFYSRTMFDQQTARKRGRRSGGFQTPDIVISLIKSEVPKSGRI